MNPEKRAWLWPILLLATIFTLSGTAQIATPDIGLQFPKDKVAHFLAFGLLATAILRIPRLGRLGWGGAAIAALITIVCGGFDELRQSLTPGRQVELADWIADAAGAIIAVIAYRHLTPYRKLLEWRFFVKQRESQEPPP